MMRLEGDEQPIQRLTKECYHPPLKLEDGKEGTFLETSFYITKENCCKHWLKNENTTVTNPKIWRYAHFWSSTDEATKRKVMHATLKKLHNMASDADTLVASALHKLHEFQLLQYPFHHLYKACNYIATTTRDTTWFRIRQALCNERSRHGG